MRQKSSVFSNISRVQIVSLNSFCNTLRRLGLVECMMFARDEMEVVENHTYNLTCDVYYDSVVCICI